MQARTPCRTNGHNLTHSLVGKHFGQAKQLDLAGVIGCIRYYAGWADKNSGKTIEVRHDHSRT